ncbi:MAG: class I SAM-dependent methyltransferase [Fibrobacteria bacterium]|nr:class I SAM-dependent methyltransferase [Fibrobacteria bacterium]
MDTERTRIEQVYTKYTHNSSKKNKWRANIAKTVVWEIIFGHIQTEFKKRLQNKSEQLTILEIGCSSGNIIKRFSSLLPFSSLHGLDIRLDSLQRGITYNTDVHFYHANAGNMPYKDKSFDIVFQFVCLSSILSKKHRAHIISESHRILKDGGIFISLDMRYWSPNPNVCAIKRSELSQYDPLFHFNKYIPVWLLPPLQKYIHSRFLVRQLCKLNILCSHWLYIGEKHTNTINPIKNINT